MRLAAAIFILLLLPFDAFAGDAATLVFRSGIRVQVDDGFKTIVEAMRRLNEKNSNHNIVELTIGGGSFVLDVAEVVIVCRDACQSLKVVDMRDPSRSRDAGR